MYSPAYYRSHRYQGIKLIHAVTTGYRILTLATPTQVSTTHHYKFNNRH